MKILLVRHAKAVKRSQWTEADDLRPLTAQGERQVGGIQRLLKDVPLRRICSSPALRCRKTVERLAADHSLNVEVDARIAADTGETVADPEGALRLLEEKAGAPLLVCAGGTLIVEILRSLGVGDDSVDSLRCEQGSIWMLERRSGAIVRAEYVPPRESSQGERRAVLDVGSTSMSLLVADVGPAKDRIQPVFRSRAELRLGASADRIGAADIDRIVQLGRSMRSEAESTGSRELITVATASLRNAANGAEVADRLSEVLESPLRVLSGPDEARIVYNSVHCRLALDTQATLVVDLGGGSLDLAVGRGSRIHYAVSEPLGVTRLHSEYVRTDPMKRMQVNAIRDRVRDKLGPHSESITDRKPLRCAATGGSVRALARLIQAKRGSGKSKNIRGLGILRTELETLADQLRRATHAERIEIPGLKSSRADLLPTGAIVLTELLGILDLPELLVSDWGLREGMLLEHSKPLVSD